MELLDQLALARLALGVRGLALVGTEGHAPLAVGAPEGWLQMRWVDGVGRLVVGGQRMVVGEETRLLGTDREGTRWHVLAAPLSSMEAVLLFDHEPVAREALRREVLPILLRMSVHRGPRRPVVLDLDAYLDAAVRVDAEGRVVYANRAGARVLGREDVIGHSLVQLLDRPADRPLLERVEEVLVGRSAARLDIPWRSPRGIWFEAHLAPTAHGVVLLFQDVTAREEAHAQLERTSRLLEYVQTHAGAGLFEWDSRRDLLTGSTGMARIVGRPIDQRPESAMGLLDRVHPDDRPAVAERMAEVVSSGESGQPMAFRMLDDEGNARAFRGMATANPWADRPGLMVGMMFDVTELRMAEEAARQREQHLRQLVETVDCYLAAGPEDDLVQLVLGRTMQVLGDPRLCALLELGPDGHLGIRRIGGELGGRVRCGCLEIHDELHERLLTGRPILTDGPLGSGDCHAAFAELTTDGELWMLVGLTWDGSVHGALVALVDRTRLPDATLLEGHVAQTAAAVARDRAVQRVRDAQEQILSMQRLDSLSRLASGLAHDLNNLLTVIHGSVGFLGEAVPSGPETRESLEHLHEATRRAGQITRQLLDVGRSRLSDPEPMCLVDALEALAALLGSMLTPRTQLRIEEIDPELWILADPRGFQHVVMNLVLNGIQAMPDGGTVRVAGGSRELAEGEVPGLSPGLYGVLAIEDDGMGMADEVRLRLFEPFFTTREAGTGLGLAAAYGFVRGLGGTIEVESEPGRGTVFRVYFRRVLPVQTLVPAAVPGSLKVVVVDDEPALLRFVTRLLERRGHRTIGFGSASEVLEAVRSGLELDLLVTDVMLPRMDGVALAREMEEHVGALPVVFITGYADSARLRAGLDRAAAAVVEKPFEPDQLVEAVLSCYARSRA